MDTKSFVYWLQGFFELSGAKELNEQQIKIIKDHIALVLKKTTPQTDPLMPPFNPYNIGPYIPPTHTSDKVYIPATGTPKLDKFEVTCELPNGNNMPLVGGSVVYCGTLNDKQPDIQTQLSC